MDFTIELLMTYGYTAVFVCVLAEQLGAPLPSTPVLMTAGAIAGLGKLNPLAARFLAVAASLIGDSVWYYLGKARGTSVLRLLCKISLEPDTCVQRTSSTYSKHGARWLLFAKFIPGVSTIAPPMAGIYRVNPWKFVVMDGAGAGLWAGAFIFAGWCFRDQTDAIATYMDQCGKFLGVSLACAILIYVLFKFIERKRVRRSFQIDRIAPMELKQRIESGEAITIVDLRNSIEWRNGRIPGSLMITAEELDALVATLPSAAMTIIYCSARTKFPVPPVRHCGLSARALS
jgi:membrane protein DedA with SNARE-associated domain